MAAYNDDSSGEELRRCNHDGEFAWFEYDAKGIPLCKVCEKCKKVKLAQFRPEILTGYSQADVDEPIEADVWFPELEGV